MRVNSEGIYRTRPWVSWRLKVSQPGEYDVTARVSSAGGVSRFAVELDKQRLHAASKPTASWEEFVPLAIGRLKADKPGAYVLSVKLLAADTWKPIGLLEVRLEPAGLRRLLIEE